MAGQSYVSFEAVQKSYDGETLVATTAVNINGVDTPTTLSLRPERVSIDADGNCPNVVEGKVAEIICLGDHIRSRVNVCGHDDSVAKVPNAAGPVHLKPGATVNVGWLAEDCRALDAPNRPVH